jgi:hypothetical protein
MYSNFVTPPDLVSDKFHTVTFIDVNENELIDIAKFCQHADTSYNIYLYRSDMDDDVWLRKAIDSSHSVVVNCCSDTNLRHCSLDKVYYYGREPFLCPAIHIDNPLVYFSKLQTV